MLGRTGTVILGAVVGVFWLGMGTAASGQVAARRPPSPQVTYGPLQAARDAQRLAEEARRRAIDRQLQVLDDVRRYRTYAYYDYALAAPRDVYGPPRAIRRAYRRGYGPVWWTWPYIYGYPYYPQVKQPWGHEKIWTSPNSYIYRPLYDPPAEPPKPPTLADPSLRPQGPPPAEPPLDAPRPPLLIPPAHPVPERIPTPPAESGPREF
jgi:hypothetical protein